jgi:hypothetical protein
MSEIREERRGAFLPVVQDPLFQVIALPFGGIGGLVLIDELIRWTS